MRRRTIIARQSGEKLDDWDLLLEQLDVEDSVSVTRLDWQHSEACQQRVDADGNWLRQTDGKIQDKAIEREVEALQNTETFQSHTRTVDDHSTESVGGIKKVEALGALKLLSGGSASLAAVDDLHQATGRDLNLVVGQKHNATVGGDMQERIEGLRRSVAGVSQRLTAPKTWLGSESVNVLQVLGDLIDLVQQMNTQLALHTHVSGPLPSPPDVAAFTAKATQSMVLRTSLRQITPDYDLDIQQCSFAMLNARVSFECGHKGYEVERR